jgi:predicted DsbA family dithiol-disulfide isomerase
VRGEAQIKQVARAEGLTFDFERTIENNTLLAHRLLRHALLGYGPKIQAALKDRLFTAHFAEGADIGDRDTLAGLAAEAGLDRDRAVAFLATDEGREEVLAEIEAAQQAGITAVPTFVFEGKWAVQGGQTSSTFLRLLEQVAEETAATATSAAGACTDDTCDVPTI